MKTPKSFIPEKDLKKNIDRLLSEEYYLSKKYSVYNSLGIEKKIDKNEIFSFDGSLERLKKDNYERHLRPWEYFGFMADYLEGKLKEDLYDLASNMLKEEGEWLSMAMKRTGNNLTCYVDPKNILWDDNEQKYFTKGALEYEYKEEFDITGIPSWAWASLKQFPDDFIKFLYGRAFESLPKRMQENSQVYLPKKGALGPVGYCSVQKFSIISIGVYLYPFSYLYHDKASRGIITKPYKESS